MQFLYDLLNIFLPRSRSGSRGGRRGRRSPSKSRSRSRSPRDNKRSRSRSPRDSKRSRSRDNKRSRSRSGGRESRLELIVRKLLDPNDLFSGADQSLGDETRRKWRTTRGASQSQGRRRSRAPGMDPPPRGISLVLERSPVPVLRPLRSPSSLYIQWTTTYRQSNITWFGPLLKKRNYCGCQVATPQISLL